MVSSHLVGGNMSICPHFIDFLNTQINVVNRHIDKHKWFNHIENKEDAVADFIEKYAWLMRDMYCEYICEHDTECDVRTTK
jgi:hypothetical protein